MTTDQKDVIQRTADYVREKFDGDSSGHDWWHMYRVWHLAKAIAVREPQADGFVTEMAALLHDVADPKLVESEAVAREEVRRQLVGFALPADEVLRIMEGITDTSFSSSLSGGIAQLSTEAQIVSDADKLDSIGAIGTARAFAFGGSKNRLIYDPGLPPQTFTDIETYRASVSPTVNHFYEKLLLLKDRMYTKAAREMAEERHTYMQQFLDEFYAEWDGKH